MREGRERRKKREREGGERGGNIEIERGKEGEREGRRGREIERERYREGGRGREREKGNREGEKEG